MSKLLGIDYGEVKCGLALADSEIKTAVPLDIVSPSELGIRIEDLIKSEDIKKIIVGLPLGMDGMETEQTKKVNEFIGDLKSKVNLEVVTEDERLTTAQAQRSQKDDAVAAMYILQSYIDRNYG